MPEYNRIRAAIYNRPWAIHPTALEAIVEIVELRAAGGRLDDDERAERIEAARSRQGPRAETGGGVAVIPILGPIVHRADLFSEISGATSTMRLSQQLRAALDDRDVSSILLDVDSPGGGVVGVEELADEIQEARKIKTITAVANGWSASAAYWLATQADELVVTPSGEVGSIGVIAEHVDFSEQIESLGVRVSLVTNSDSPHKAEFHEALPLSEDSRAELQSKVDAYADTFIRAVARGRRTSISAVRDNMGAGRMVLARDAVERGMADRVAPMSQVLDELRAGKKSRRRPRSAAARLRLVGA